MDLFFFLLLGLLIMFIFVQKDLPVSDTAKLGAIGYVSIAYLGLPIEAFQENVDWLTIKSIFYVLSALLLALGLYARGSKKTSVLKAGLVLSAISIFSIVNSIEGDTKYYVIALMLFVVFSIYRKTELRYRKLTRLRKAQDRARI